MRERIVDARYAEAEALYGAYVRAGDGRDAVAERLGALLARHGMPAPEAQGVVDAALARARHGHGEAARASRAAALDEILILTEDAAKTARPPVPRPGGGSQP